jgi:hypothetical protein
VKLDVPTLFIDNVHINTATCICMWHCDYVSYNILVRGFYVTRNSVIVIVVVIPKDAMCYCCVILKDKGLPQ